ncbi:MAG: hypothetical protein ACTSPK_08490 [Candidatus Heimdallarchaeota archaeon]
MSEYTIKAYEPGFEVEQEKIGIEVASKWNWPFQYMLPTLKEMYSKEDFDPETVQFCFEGKKMVGYVMARIGVQEGVVGPGLVVDEGLAASLDYPRVLPEHEEAAELLMEKIVAALEAKGVKLIQTRVTTMRENSVQLARKFGFKPHNDFPLGYKLYYEYDLNKGFIAYCTENVKAFNLERDIDTCSEKVAKFFKITEDNAKILIKEIDTNEELISHLVIRNNGDMFGYSYTLPNDVRKDVVALYYIEATTEDYLRELIVQSVNRAIMKDGKTFIIDVVNELLLYEFLYKELGFTKVAKWGIFEKRFKKDD